MEQTDIEIVINAVMIMKIVNVNGEKMNVLKVIPRYDNFLSYSSMNTIRKRGGHIDVDIS